MTKAISLDCETLGVGTPQPYLLEIGVCVFDTSIVEDNKLSASRPTLRLDIEHGMQLGGTVTPSTVFWWLNQSDTMKALMDKRPRLFIKIALEQLQSFIWNNTSRYGSEVWVRGDDHTWLEEAYKSYQLQCPWQYNGVRDQRTLAEFAKSKGWSAVQRTTAHDGLRDALDQAEDIVSIYDYFTTSRG